jgi:hypothetical protein
MIYVLIDPVAMVTESYNYGIIRSICNHTVEVF